MKILSHFVEIKKGLVKVTNADATIKSLSELSDGGFVQAFPSQLVYSKRQVLAGIYSTLKLFESNSNRLKNPALELLLVVSAKTQLEQAIGSLGLSNGSFEAYVVSCFANKKKAVVAIKKAQKALSFKDSTTKRPGEKKIERFYGVTKKELASCKQEKDCLEKLVIEKMALAVM